MVYSHVESNQAGMYHYADADGKKALCGANVEGDDRIDIPDPDGFSVCMKCRHKLEIARAAEARAMFERVANEIGWKTATAMLIRWCKEYGLAIDGALGRSGEWEPGV